LEVGAVSDSAYPRKIWLISDPYLLSTHLSAYSSSERDFNDDDGEEEEEKKICNTFEPFTPILTNNITNQIHINESKTCII
jgi:hypothetical protein